ncbi:MAG: hypothetical protein M0Q92_04395 [Methanoregula sp.]|jgi:hypothetical protein|nr:hypothetical protein [Methanoregula sp.]
MAARLQYYEKNMSRQAASQPMISRQVSRDSYMKIKDMMETLLKNSPELGTFTVTDLVRYARSNNVNGLAEFHGDEKELYLAVIDGEPEGAIYIDPKGELFGDNAVMLITGKEQFTLRDVQKEFLDAVVMGCRIFNKSHIRTNTSAEIPEFGTRSAGLGKLTLIVRSGDKPQNGIRVSIRKNGQILGSDVTTDDGSVGFRVMYGNYDCVLQDRNQMITTRRIIFDAGNPEIILGL